MNRAVSGTVRAANDALENIGKIKEAIKASSKNPLDLLNKANEIEDGINDAMVKLVGNESIRKRDESDPPSINDRIESISWDLINTASAPTRTHEKSYQVAVEKFSEVHRRLKYLIEVELEELKNMMEDAKAPWTPGRFPDWKQ